MLYLSIKYKKRLKNRTKRLTVFQVDLVLVIIRALCLRLKSNTIIQLYPVIMLIYQQRTTLPIGLSCIHLNLVERVLKAQRFIPLVITLERREFVRYIHPRKLQKNRNSIRLGGSLPPSGDNAPI